MSGMLRAETRLQDALRDFSLDLKAARLNQRFSKLEDTLAWHEAADATNRNSLKDSGTLAKCITILNDLKAKYNAHRVDTTVHNASDTANDVTAADATNQATAETLANDIKTQFIAHFVQTATPDVHQTTVGINSDATTLVGDTTQKITSANASDLATLITLTEELQNDYYWHTFRGPFAFDEDDMSVYGR